MADLERQAQATISAGQRYLELQARAAMVQGRRDAWHAVLLLVLGGLMLRAAQGNDGTNTTKQIPNTNSSLA